MYAILNLFNTVITIYIWLLIASAGAELADRLQRDQYRQPVRLPDPRLPLSHHRPAAAADPHLLPDLGGIDISPIVLILALYFIRDLAFETLMR